MTPASSEPVGVVAARVAWRGSMRLGDIWDVSGVRENEATSLSPASLIPTNVTLIAKIWLGMLMNQLEGSFICMGLAYIRRPNSQIDRFLLTLVLLFSYSIQSTGCYIELLLPLYSSPNQPRGQIFVTLPLEGVFSTLASNCMYLHYKLFNCLIQSLAKAAVIYRRMKCWRLLCIVYMELCRWVKQTFGIGKRDFGNHLLFFSFFFTTRRDWSRDREPDSSAELGRMVWRD